MDKIIIEGGHALDGIIEIAGAKNACLTLMPAALLTDEPLTLTNVPRLSDIHTMTQLLESLGAEVASLKDGQVVTIATENISSDTADYEIVRKMRASNLVLGPMLARNGKAILSLPGGCAIGARPMDIHLSGLEAMGAKMELRDGYIHAQAPNGLHGAEFELHFPSVGATENLMMAATLASGVTVLKNAAKEPEIVDLAKCLTAMGAKIDGAGSATITIIGVAKLHGATHRVVCDRIELGTYMIAPVIAGGSIELIGGKRELLETFCKKLEQAGAIIETTDDGLRVSRREGRIQPVDIVTEVHPGFPTDLQAQMMALLAFADGDSILEETIFENRFMHAPELLRMGAQIDVQGGTATVTGVAGLKGARVMATDLRASVSLILAGLAALGETTVARVYHLDRGYEQLVRKLTACGAVIRREKE